MYTKAQLETIKQMWDDLWPIKEIAKKLQKSEIAVIEKVKNMQLPERDHHLVRTLNFYGRHLLKYGNTRQQIKDGLRQEYNEKRLERSVGRADRQQVAIDYLRYELDHGHDKIKAMKRAYNREATASKIGKIVRMPTRDVTAIVKTMKGTKNDHR